MKKSDGRNKNKRLDNLCMEEVYERAHQAQIETVITLFTYTK